MKYLFLEYPKCSTCQKAKQWLLNNSIEFEERHIDDCPPTGAELQNWIRLSERDIKSFYNTSGLKYKALELSKKLPEMSQDEQIKLLTSDGMLIKRPLLVGENIVFSGFHSQNWEILKD